MGIEIEDGLHKILIYVCRKLVVSVLLGKHWVLFLLLSVRALVSRHCCCC